VKIDLFNEIQNRSPGRKATSGSVGRHEQAVLDDELGYGVGGR